MTSEGVKILALVTDDFGGYGGIARYNRDLVTALVRQARVGQVQVHPRHQGTTVPLPAGVRRLSPVENRVLYALRALWAAWSFKPDVIFCGHLYMAPLAWLLARVLRRPWWLQVHGIEAWTPPEPWPYLAVKSSVARADLVTAVSRYTRRRFLSWATVPMHRVRVLPNTYEPPAPATLSREELKARHGLAGHKVLLTVSRIDRADRYKGHQRVLDVLPHLRQEFPDLVYVIAGDGDNREGLEQTARSLVPPGCVRFVGRVSEAELSDYYRMSDAFVMPSSKEGFGIVFLEAAAHDLPVVAGNVDGSVDACAEGVLGAGVDPADSSRLLAALSSALRSGENPGGKLAYTRFGVAAFTAGVGRVLGEASVATGQAA